MLAHDGVHSRKYFAWFQSCYVDALDWHTFSVCYKKHMLESESLGFCFDDKLPLF